MKVYIMGYLKDSEKLTASIAWSSISLFPSSEMTVPSDKEIERIFRLSREMKLSSVLDFPFYIFSFKDVSRSFTHQWVRYRIAAHVQQSLRFVKVDTEIEGGKPWFVIPPSVLKQGAETIVKYVRTQLEMGRMYRELLKKGIPPEDARFILPMGVKTHISSVMNAEELLHVIDQRACFDAQWEIRSAAYALLAGLYSISPRIFKHAGPYCMSEKTCRGKSKGSCYKLAEKLTRKMFEKGEELRDLLKDSDKDEYVGIDLTGELGYIVSRDVKEKVARLLGFPLELDYRVELYVRKL
ncbi:MAG: FAD-dependent thymidylate synthase [Thermoprotei archaeon]|mgnify:CR=1 FL=1|nr:MAG: FAD-dependent thymidylate synthase [Thermoprotei archaeon]HDI31515.1 FAD-dependent thymidylate synthase [Thermofilum sp.]